MLLPDINLSSLLVILFGGGGVAGGLIALLKYKRESDGVIAQAAEKTVKAQDMALENLRAEIVRLNGLVNELNKKLAERERRIDELTNKIVELTRKFDESITSAKNEVIAAIH